MEAGAKSVGVAEVRGGLTDEALLKFLGADRLAIIGGRFAVIFAHRLAQKAPINQLVQLVDELVTRGAEHVVLISSAAVTGLNHRHPGMVAEDQLPRVEQANRTCEHWRGVEIAVAERVSGHAGVVLTLLRSPTVLTNVATGFPATLFRRWSALRYMGFNPQIQLLSPEDLATDILTLIDNRAGGLYHSSPRETIGLFRALKIARVRGLPFPRSLAGITSFLARAFSGAANRDELDLIRHPWTISDRKLEKLRGRRPQFTSEGALRAYLETKTVSREKSPAEAPDPFGSDIKYMRFHRRLWLGFLSRFYWRIEVEGLENIPADGAAIIVGLHRGFMPFDGLMIVQLLRRRAGRVPRFLIHPTLVKFPFISKLMRGFGGVVACHENADNVLESGQLLGVFPEGISGAFKLYKDAYVLGRFGRPDYVKMAARHGAPVVPFVVLGSAEVYPILARIRWRWFRRLMEWPFLPIVPLPFPLPTKWHIKFFPAIEAPRADGSKSEPDAKQIREFHSSVTHQIQSELDDMRSHRHSIFFGSIFKNDSK